MPRAPRERGGAAAKPTAEPKAHRYAIDAKRREYRADSEAAAREASEAAARARHAAEEARRDAEGCRRAQAIAAQAPDDEEVEIGDIRRL